MPLTRRAVAVAVALALAGCAAGDARLAVVPPEPLALHHWPSRGPARAVILALHGFGDTGALTYADAARYWASRGIAVYAPDQRGFGANASRRTWPGAEALIADTVQLAATLRQLNPGLPLVVVGHSMGGGLALAAAAQGLPADALVLAAPAIAGGDALNPILRAASRTLAAAAPEHRWTGEGIVAIHPTDNIAALRRAACDPLHFADPSSRELFGLVRIMDSAAAAAPTVDIPTLTLIGAHDEVLDPARVYRIAARIPGEVGFIYYPDGWHWLFSDLQAARVWKDVADFALSGHRATGLTRR